MRRIPSRVRCGCWLPHPSRRGSTPSLAPPADAAVTSSSPPPPPPHTWTPPHTRDTTWNRFTGSLFAQLAACGCRRGPQQPRAVEAATA
eukprot:ctg_6770.g597